MTYKYLLFFFIILSISSRLDFAAEVKNTVEEMNYPVLEPDGHKAKINKIIFTDDEKYLVSCSDDKTIRVWNIETGENVRTFRGFVVEGYTGMVYSIALSPDNRYIAAGGWFPEDSVRIYDFNSGNIVKILRGNKDVLHNLSFSSDGRYLASCAHDGSVLVWNIDAATIGNSKLLYNFHRQNKPVYNISFNSNSSLLASASYDHSIIIWDLNSGNPVQIITNVFTNEVYGAEFSPSETIFAASGFDGTVRLFNFNEAAKNINLPGKIISQVNLNYTQEIKFIPDSKYLLYSGSYSMKDNDQWFFPIFFYNVETGKTDKMFLMHNNTVRSIAVSKSGSWIASTGGNDNEIYIYDKNLEIKRKIAGSGKSVFSVAFGNDNGKIYFGTKNDGKTYLAESTIDKSFSFMDFVLQNGSDSYYHRIYTLSGNRFFNFEFKLFNGTIFIGSNIITLPDSYDTIRCYSLTPDGKFAIIGSDFKLAKADAETGKIIGFFTGHEGPVWSISVSLNGKYMASGSDDQTIKIWDLENMKLITTLFVSTGGEWIIWTTEGFFYCSKNAARFLKIIHNQGYDKESIVESADSESYTKKYYQPEKIKSLLSDVFKFKVDTITPAFKKEEKITNSREDIIPDNLPDF